MKKLTPKEMETFNLYLELHSPFKTDNFVFCLLTFPNLDLQELTVIKSVHEKMFSNNYLSKDLNIMIDVHDRSKFTFEFLNGIIKNPKFVNLKVIPSLENEKIDLSFILGDKGLAFLFKCLRSLEYGSIDYLRFLYLIISIFGRDRIIPFLFSRPDLLTKPDDKKEVSGVGVMPEDILVDPKSFFENPVIIDENDPKFKEYIEDCIEKQRKILARKEIDEEDLLKRVTI